jgi:hypothetical protein
MYWVEVLGVLAAMNTAINADCRVAAERYHAMARETASAQDAIRYRKAAKYWEQGGAHANSPVPEAAYPPSEVDEAFAKEVEELMRNAQYDDDWDTYFQVFRQKGLRLERAGTFAGNPLESKYRPEYESPTQRIYRFPNGWGASIVKIEEGPRKGRLAFATLRFREPNNPASTWYIDHLRTSPHDLDIDEKTIEARLDEIANMKGDDKA